MKVTPKLTSELNAVRLTKDITARKGQWLVFDQHDHVAVLDEAELLARFDFDNVNAPLALPAPSQIRRKSGGTRNMRNKTRMRLALRRGMARNILRVLADGDKPMHVNDISSKLLLRRNSVSTIVTHLRRQKFVAVTNDVNPLGGKAVYELTDKGKATVAKFE